MPVVFTYSQYSLLYHNRQIRDDVAQPNFSKEAKLSHLTVKLYLLRLLQNVDLIIL